MMEKDRRYFVLTPYVNTYAVGGNVGFNEVMEEENKDLYNLQLQKQKEFTNGTNGGGVGWGSVIGAAGTNIANAFLDNGMSTAERVANALGIPALAKQWTADTSKGDAFLNSAQENLDKFYKNNYIQDASSSLGAANAVKLNNQQIIKPIMQPTPNLSAKDFKGNWWRNTGAAISQGAASGSVGGPWGALGGAVTGLFGSIGGLFGRRSRAKAAYEDFQKKFASINSAQQSAYKQALTNQSLSNMQALANGNIQQRISDMANIRAYGGNLYPIGGTIKEGYEEADQEPVYEGGKLPEITVSAESMPWYEKAWRKGSRFVNNNIISPTLGRAQYAWNYINSKLADDDNSSYFLDLSNNNVKRVRENNQPDVDAILANDFVETDNPNSLRRKADFTNTSDTLIGDMNIPLRHISTYYGIEDGKLKAGTLDSFKDNTLIAPNRASNIGKIKEWHPSSLIDETYKHNPIARWGAEKLGDLLSSSFVSDYVTNKVMESLSDDDIKSLKELLLENDGIENPTQEDLTTAAILYTDLIDSNPLQQKISDYRTRLYDYADEKNPTKVIKGFAVNENNDTIPDYNFNTYPKGMFADENGNAVFFSGLTEENDRLINEYLKKHPSYPVMLDNGRFSHYTTNNDLNVYSGGMIDPNETMVIGVTNNTKAMGGNLYTDLSPNMMSLWNNKQQIDQQKAMNQQFSLGLGNSFNQKMFAYGGDTEEPIYIQGVTDVPLEHRALSKSLWDKEEAYRRAKEAEFYDRYRKDWGDKTPLYANMTEDEFVRKSNGEGDDPNYIGLPLSAYNQYKYRKYLYYPNTTTFNNAHLFIPDIKKLREKYPLSELPVYKKNGSWYLKEGIPASNGYKNTESGGHKIPQQFLQDTLDELRRRAWTNEYYDTTYDLGDDLPKRIHFQGNSDVYIMRNDGKYVNKKGETWDVGDYNDIRQLLKEGQAKDYDEYRKDYLKHKKEQDKKAQKRQEEGHIDDYWHKEIDNDFMTNPIVEHDEIVVTPKSSNSSQNVSKSEKSARQKSYDAFTEDFGGSDGVRNFQEKYNMYHPESKIKVDGIAGPETVRAFQKWNNEYGSNNVYGLDKLAEDGWYGDKSREYFTSGIAKRNLNYAYGGSMTSPYSKEEVNKYAEGGSVEYPNGTQYYANGGTHEENPYGGIQIGVDQQGTPNLAERGEFRWNDFIFSDRINVDANLLQSFNLPPATRHQSKKAQKGKLSYADMAKKYAKKHKELENDPASKNSFEAYMQRLANAQEYQKKEAELEAQKQNEMQNYKTALNQQHSNPMYGTMKYNGMGNTTQTDVNEGIGTGIGNAMANAELSNVNRSGNEMLHAYGGNIFWRGGYPINPFRIPSPSIQNPNPVFNQNDWTNAHSGNFTRQGVTFDPYDLTTNPPYQAQRYTDAQIANITDPIVRQRLLVNEGYDIGNSGPNGDGVDGDWGNKSKAAWDNFNLTRRGYFSDDLLNLGIGASQIPDGSSNADAQYTYKFDDNNGDLNRIGLTDGITNTTTNNLTGNVNTNDNTIIGKKTTNTNADAAIPPSLNDVPLYNTNGKYMQFAKGLTKIIDDGRNFTNIPYERDIRPTLQLEALGQRGPFYRTVETIGGYRAPNLMDVERQNNAAQAQALAQMNGINNIGNGNRGYISTYANQIGYNTGLGIGNNYATTQQYNDTNRFQTDQYNLGIDATNAAAINQQYQDNQRADQLQQQMAITAKQADNDYIQRENQYADKTNAERTQNRADNLAAWFDNAANFFTTQAMENQELNTINNDPTNPYYIDKNGVTHYVGDNGLTALVQSKFKDGNGTFTGDRLTEWNNLTKKYKAKDLYNHPELWEHLVKAQEIANATDAQNAKLDQEAEHRALMESYKDNVQRLNDLRALGIDISDDIYNRYNDWASEDYADNWGLLRDRNRYLDDFIKNRYNAYDKYLYEKKLLNANKSAYGGHINNPNKYNGNYYSYMSI